MSLARVWVTALGCLAVACGEEGTSVAVDAGGSDATGGHDVEFVPQQNAPDAGDAAMEVDSTAPPDEGGDAPSMDP